MGATVDSKQVQQSKLRVMTHDMLKFLLHRSVVHIGLNRYSRLYPFEMQHIG